MGDVSYNLSIIKKEQNNTLEDVLNLPLEYAEKFKKKVIVVFDEFQEINKLNGDNFEKELRSLIQFHQNVTYLFLGSKTHLLLNMFRDKNRAFYNIGKFMKLGKISDSEYRKFIISNFQKFGISILESQINYMLEVTEGIPFYVQFLSSELWQYVITVKNRVENKDIERAIQNILSSQTDYYFELFGKLSQYQKKLLLALKENGKEVFSKNYSDKFGLSSASSTQRAAIRGEKIYNLRLYSKIG